MFLLVLVAAGFNFRFEGTFAVIFSVFVSYFSVSLRLFVFLFSHFLAVSAEKAVGLAMGSCQNNAVVVPKSLAGTATSEQKADKWGCLLPTQLVLLIAQFSAATDVAVMIRTCKGWRIKQEVVESLPAVSRVMRRARVLQQQNNTQVVVFKAEKAKKSTCEHVHYDMKMATCMYHEHHRSDMDSQCGWSHTISTQLTQVCRRCKKAASVSEVWGYTNYSWDDAM